MTFSVLLVSHHYPPHVGGLEIVAQRQAISLAEQGYRVTVITSEWGAEATEERRDRHVQTLRIQAWHVMENRFFIPFPFFSPSLIPTVWKQVGNADIVHIHDVFYMSSWIAAMFAAIRRKPMFLTQHVALVEHASSLVMGIQRAVYTTLGAWLFGRARKIVAYNRNVRDFLTHRGVPERRILHCNNGIDTIRFRPAMQEERQAIRERHQLPQTRPLVLFVGRLVDKKGVRILLDAKDSAFDLVFAGPGPVPVSGRVDGVHWLGALDQSATAEIYRACDVFAFPAIGEIFTLTMQEAMASQLPVITTDDPAYIDNDMADGVVLSPRRADAFRESILALLSSDDRRHVLGVRCRETALRHFDWNFNIHRLMEAYAEALTER